MEEWDSIGGIIKWYCKCRNKRLKDVAAFLGMKKSTFSMALKNDTLTADDLMKLAAYLDFDLNEMMIELGYSGKSSFLFGSTVPRMSAAHREIELEIVNKRLADLLQMYPNSIPTVRNELLKYYYNNMAFLLDIILPENARIEMFKSLYNPKEEDYFVGSAEKKAAHGLLGVTGKHVLDTIISKDNPEKIVICCINDDGNLCDKNYRTSSGRFLDDLMECRNFMNEDGYCYGFVQKIRYLLGFRNLDKVDIGGDYLEDVTVIWCVPNSTTEVKIVGWYEHANAYQPMQCRFAKSISELNRCFAFKATEENVYLLPQEERNKLIELREMRENQLHYDWLETFYDNQVLIPEIMQYIKEHRSQRINM